MNFTRKLSTLAMIFSVGMGNLSSGQESPFLRQISTAELENVLAKEDWVVVDARSSDEFNGWDLENSGLGGHISGATNFDFNWLRVEIPQRDERLTQVLAAKQILKSKKIAVYSSREFERIRVGEFLKKHKFEKLYSFDLKEWTKSKKPIRRFPEFQKLLPASVVKELVDGKRPSTFGKAKTIRFVEVSWGDEKASYAKGHVPGSFHINTDHFEPPPSWYLGSPAVLTKFASDYGLQHDDTIVLSSHDVMASYRLAVVLEYMGVVDVRVLNGGLSAWKRAGFELETNRHAPPPSAEFGVKIPQKSDLILATPALKDKLGKSAEFTLVDTRTWAEFVGEKSGYSYHKHKGRIPNSKYGQGKFKGKDSMIPYRNIDGTMRNPDEILELWKSAKIDANHHLSFYCGGGWRAAEVLTFARVMGLRKSTLYSDGWIGWSNDRMNKIDTGVPTK